VRISTDCVEPDAWSSMVGSCISSKLWRYWVVGDIANALYPLFRVLELIT